MVGGAICGYWAIGSVNTAIAPAMIHTIERTIAKTGRSIKKCAIFIGALPLIIAKRTERRFSFPAAALVFGGRTGGVLKCFHVLGGSDRAVGVVAQRRVLARHPGAGSHS